jgi:hypothetical protein
MLSPGSSSRGTPPHSQSDNMLLESLRSSSFVPSQHGTAPSSHTTAHARDHGIESDDNITIHTMEEWERFTSLRTREFLHTCVYDVKLLKRVGMDIEFPTIFHAISWEKLYEASRLGLHLLTLEFLTSFDSFTRGRKSYVCFHLFQREFEFQFSRFSELMDFF